MRPRQHPGVDNAKDFQAAREAGWKGPWRTVISRERLNDGDRRWLREQLGVERLIIGGLVAIVQ
jgi:hypothetical protein